MKRRMLFPVLVGTGTAALTLMSGIAAQAVPNVALQLARGDVTSDIWP